MLSPGVDRVKVTCHGTFAPSSFTEPSEATRHSSWVLRGYSTRSKESVPSRWVRRLGQRHLGTAQRSAALAKRCDLGGRLENRYTAKHVRTVLGNALGLPIEGDLLERDIALHIVGFEAIDHRAALDGNLVANVLGARIPGQAVVSSFPVRVPAHRCTSTLWQSWRSCPGRSVCRPTSPLTRMAALLGP